MIITEQFEIDKTDNLTSSYLEAELKKLNVVPLRYAIIEVEDDKYVLSVSYEKTV